MDQPRNPSRPDDVTAPPADAPPAPAGEAPPLGPLEWLKVNGPLLLVLAALVAWLFVRTGPVGLWKAFLVAVGIGLVIFVHELGHFLAAKWCDVHVTTFSIGFGPAIPGCSFRKGETLYKLALLPLGGYVNMIGEGPEADEDESYPRSFKNKPVGQRMFIISAGVIMNVLFGCLCFILVYRFPGERRLPAVIGGVQPGSPAWKAGVHSAMKIAEINGDKEPYWDNLKIEVASAPAGRSIPFVFQDTRHRDLRVDLTPRKEAGDDSPVIGVAPAQRLRLISSRQPGVDGFPPVFPQSPAESARVVDLRPGDTLLASTTPEGGDKLGPLPGEPRAALAELSRRLESPELAGKPIKLQLRRKGAAEPETVTVAPNGFAYEDRVVGMTDPDADDLLTVSALPPDPFPEPTDNSSGNDRHDFFAYQDRMKLLAGQPVLVQVRRKAPGKHGDETVTVLVPPAHHHTLGLRMTMGKVSAVRDGSPAERAGVQEGDQLTKVVVWTPAGQAEFKTGDVDPTVLPSLLAAEAAKWSPARQSGAGAAAGLAVAALPKRVTLTVLRPDKRNEERQLEPVGWDDSREFSEEQPVVPQAPLSVPQLGLAYLVQSTVAAVEPDSPAARAGAQAGDKVVKIRFRKPPEKKGDSPTWGEWIDLKGKARYDPGDAYEQWAYINLSLQSRDEVQMLVKGADGKEVYLPGRTDSEPEGVVTAVADAAWPQAERGVIFEADVWVQKADNTWTALVYGVRRTGEFIRQIMLNLRAVVTGRVSTKSFAGPVGIASTAFAMASDPFDLLLILGIISVNLAVANFLPIPVLDGGHMVFLIYEKLRGRRPSEAVQTGATIAGVVFLLTLVVLITFQDVGSLGLFRWARHLWPGR